MARCRTTPPWCSKLFIYLKGKGAWLPKPKKTSVGSQESFDVASSVDNAGMVKALALMNNCQCCDVMFWYFAAMCKYHRCQVSYEYRRRRRTRLTRLRHGTTTHLGTGTWWRRRWTASTRISSRSPRCGERRTSRRASTPRLGVPAGDRNDTGHSTQLGSCVPWGRSGHPAGQDGILLGCHWLLIAQQTVWPAPTPG